MISGVVSRRAKGKCWVGVGVRWRAKLAMEEEAAVGERYSIQVGSWSDLLGPAYSGSA